MTELCINCKHSEANHPFYDGVDKIKCKKFEPIVIDSFAKAMKYDPQEKMKKKETTMDMFRYGKLVMAREFFDKFDKFSCIKNDKWYLDFKKELLEKYDELNATKGERTHERIL